MFSEKYLVMRHVIISLLLLSRFVCCHTSTESDFMHYLIKRQQIIDEEQSMSFGSKIILDEEEERVNKILMKHKNEELQTDHPDFMGIKWIYSPQRKVPHATFNKYTKTFRSLKKMYPNVLIGFDLVGQEDRGRPLKEFAEKLLILGKETQFFFHADETNWSGQETDENLYDAILLNTKRIGHGYALIKHPKLMKLVKEKRIAIEINPISNQVLKLVTDLRNHPASYFFAENMPVVVSNDDPGFWGARAFSYDFYEAFIGIMSSGADLRAPKQLALNSIAYSCMNNSENQMLTDVWNKRWSSFLSEIVDDA